MNIEYRYYFERSLNPAKVEIQGDNAIIYINRYAEDYYTPKEMNFWIEHEVGHTKYKDGGTETQADLYALEATAFKYNLSLRSALSAVEKLLGTDSQRFKKLFEKVLEMDKKVEKRADGDDPTAGSPIFTEISRQELRNLKDTDAQGNTTIAGVIYDAVEMMEDNDFRYFRFLKFNTPSGGSQSEVIIALYKVSKMEHKKTPPLNVPELSQRRGISIGNNFFSWEAIFLFIGICLWLYFRNKKSLMA
jgi:uncharacterized protein YdcH (DUF465 family)